MTHPQPPDGGKPATPPLLACFSGLAKILTECSAISKKAHTKKHRQDGKGKHIPNISKNSVEQQWGKGELI